MGGQKKNQKNGSGIPVGKGQNTAVKSKTVQPVPNAASMAAAFRGNALARSPPGSVTPVATVPSTNVGRNAQKDLEENRPDVGEKSDLLVASGDGNASDTPVTLLVQARAGEGNLSIADISPPEVISLNTSEDSANGEALENTEVNEPLDANGPGHSENRDISLVNVNSVIVNDVNASLSTSANLNTSDVYSTPLENNLANSGDSVANRGLLPRALTNLTNMEVDTNGDIPDGESCAHSRDGLPATSEGMGNHQNLHENLNGTESGKRGLPDSSPEENSESRNPTKVFKMDYSRIQSELAKTKNELKKVQKQFADYR